MSDSDDDTPTLSAAAQMALQEFYAEQAQIQQAEEEQQLDGEARVMPQEDWQFSQFWYSDETATKLAQEVLAVTGEHGSVACISCPTLYKKLRDLKNSTCKAVILEYDRRFEVFGKDFIQYDFNRPLKLNSDLQRSFDIVVADPPYLTEECLSKTVQTIKYLAKDKVLLCTGAVMEELAEKLLQAKVCEFIPSHERNLANVFRCYANYTTTYLHDKS